jgi:hypothetical protein
MKSPYLPSVLVCAFAISCDKSAEPPLAPAPASSLGASPLDYDRCIQLDAEALAEGGIGEAYASLVPELRMLVPEPAQVQELLDADAGRYSVRGGGREFLIYEPGSEDGSWSRATVALFAVVNDQLTQSDHRLYAINGGNDLCGMVLTGAEAEAARRALARKGDWPYLPTLEAPWYGQYHQ